MTGEARERALLVYLSSDPDDNRRYRSFTTIFEQFDRPKVWQSSYALDADIDDKEILRTILDEMVLDGLVEARMDGRDYERSYKISDQGLYESSFDDPLFVVTDEQTGVVAAPVDRALWTGITATTINDRNARVISGLIDKALEGLSDADASNSEMMQAAAFLKAAKELVDAPEPPSEIIWQLISKAADLVGLMALFYTIFSQVKN